MGFHRLTFFCGTDVEGGMGRGGSTCGGGGVGLTDRACPGGVRMCPGPCLSG